MIQEAIRLNALISGALLPTPKKQFYHFNIGDIFRTFGVLFKINSNEVGNEYKLVQLFYHESVRVYMDRLMEAGELSFVREQINACVRRLQPVAHEQITAQKMVLWGQLKNQDVNYVPYSQLTDAGSLKQTLEAYIEEYNNSQAFSANSQKHLNLIMFQSACEAVIKIMRIIQVSKSHCLVIGTGGKGKNSLARLSCYIAEYKLHEFQHEIVQRYKLWENELKKIIIGSCTENLEIGILISGEAYRAPQQFELLNQLAINGDLYSIYSFKEIEEISQNFKSEQQGAAGNAGASQEENNLVVYQKFVQRVKNNIHLIVNLSPEYQSTHLHMRQFPFLINRCQIVYLDEWSEEALNSVAKQQLIDLELTQYFQETAGSYIQSCIQLFKSVQSKVALQRAEFHKQAHTTGVNFLFSFQIFRNIIQQKSAEIDSRVKNMEDGVDMIDRVKAQVQDMETYLSQLKPQLEKSQQETDTLLRQIMADKEIMNKKQELVTLQQQDAIVDEQRAQQLKKEAEDAVADVNYQLEQTLINIQKIKREHLIEVKSMTQPPIAVKVSAARGLPAAVTSSLPLLPRYCPSPNRASVLGHAPAPRPLR